MGLRGTPWDSVGLMAHGHTALAFSLFFVWQEEADAIRMQAECTTELPRCKPAGSDVPRVPRHSRCAPGWDKEWRNWRRRVVKSCEELSLRKFVSCFFLLFFCVLEFSLYLLVRAVRCAEGNCRQINRFHFRVLFRNLACSRQLCRPPTIFTGEGCVLAERISHHRTSRDSILLQNCCFRFCRVCSAFFDHLWYSWDFATFMPGDETTTTTTKKVVSEYAKPAWHEIVKPTAQKPILWVIVDRRSP